MGNCEISIFDVENVGDMHPVVSSSGVLLKDPTWKLFDKKNRYAGRLFKVAQSLPGASEAPPLPPTTVVADFKRRRKETEAERFVILIR